MRGKDYDLLNLQEVQARLAQPPDQQTTHPETGTCRALFDFPDLLLTPTGPRTRVIVATQQAPETGAKIGTTRGEVVYELFYTALPQATFTPANVVDLYLHRGGFECVLADEDREQDADRWCSHTAWGQEFWHILAQWIWNFRLELGHTLYSTPMRTTEFAPAKASEPAEATPDLVSRSPEPAPFSTGHRSGHAHSYTKGFAGADFSLQPDGTLLCPAGRPLYAQEAPTRARWLTASAVCRADRSLPRLSTPQAVSRIGDPHQSATRECCLLACLFTCIGSSSDPLGRLGAALPSAGGDDAPSSSAC